MTGPPQAPTWRARLDYWLGEVPLGGLQWLLFHVLRVLPVELVSGLGALLGRAAGTWVYPLGLRTAMTNLRWLEPGWDEARVRQVAMAHFENAGRVKAEFAILHRLRREGRIEIENAAGLEAARAAGPVVVVACHVGNWEVLAPVMASLDIPVIDIYEPQPDRLQTRLAMRVREACVTPGSVFLTRNANAPRQALKWLAAGGTLVIFCDEEVGGSCSVPFFGRAPHARSNYAFAVRFARLARATLLPMHVTRRPGCRFTAHVGQPIELQPAGRSRDDLLGDIVRVDAALEPIVRSNLDSWWWLGWAFAGVDYGPDVVGKA